MKKTILLIICLFSINLITAQDKDSTLFDFWVGKWNVSWENQDGTIGKGTNHIAKTLDGTVIQENFRAINDSQIAGFKGTSISVYNPNTSIWHQAWADNSGGYFNFIGEIDGDKRIFKTHPVKKEDKVIVLRMVFYDITEDALTWDWERSDDGGENWQLNWRINYTRAE